MRRGFIVKEMEAKEAKYRENWLARWNHATQAEAAQVSAKMLICKWRQKEGECAGAVLRLKLGKIGPSRQGLLLLPGPPHPGVDMQVPYCS